MEAPLQSITKSLVYVWVRDGKGVEHRFDTTSEHPFWTEKNGWVAALHLKAGDVLRGLAGQRVVVRVEDSGIASETYNLSIEGLRSYFVGPPGQEVLVHNQDLDFPNSGAAIDEALDWLRGQGVDVETLQPRKTTWGFGMFTADNVSRYRIEFDARSGAHINVVSHKAKRPHLRFPGNEKSYQTLVRRLFCP